MKKLKRSSETQFSNLIKKYKKIGFPIDVNQQRPTHDDKRFILFCFLFFFVRR